MENELDKNESKKHNIFTDLNFVKNSKINFNYFECIHQVKNVKNNLENLIDLIEDSIASVIYKPKKKQEKKNYKNDFKKRPVSAQTLLKPDKIFSKTSIDIKDESKKKNFNSSINSIYTSKNYRKRKFKFKTSQSMFLKKNHINNELNHKKQNHIKNGNNTQCSSFIIGNYCQRRDSKFNTMKYKNDTSSRNKIFNSNTSTHKTNNNSMITLCVQNQLTANNKRPQSATIIRSINDYIHKNYNYKNNSKNIYLSLYRSQTSLHINNKIYKKLKPKYLMEILKKSKNIQNSYKKDLKDVHMNRNTRELMEIAEKEIKMKDPEYHKKQIFKNILKIKKTINYAHKMRDELKYKMIYYGPGSINNKVYIRKKSANLIRFCDTICHMRDEKFYMYQNLLKDLYPNLTKDLFKKKYKISERDNINEKKMKDNEEKINKLILLLKKH